MNGPEHLGAVAGDMHTDPATAPSASCRWCGLHLVKLLGIWTDDDYSVTCYEQPKFPGDHEPADLIEGMTS